MKPLTTEMLVPYIGGQIEVQNQGEGYLFRGEIKTAEVTNENELKITLNWMAKGVGRPPIPSGWVSESRLDYAFSLSCKCGGEEINFVVRSNDRQKLDDNWESLIRETPFKHYIQHLRNPNDHVHVPVEYFDSGRHHGNPLARWVESRGGHCSGGAGCS